MKRLFVLLLFGLMLTGCHSSKFESGSSQMSGSDLSRVLDSMMEEGNFGAQTEVPYNKVSLYLDYSKQRTLIESIQFNVPRRQKGEEWDYKNTSCFNENGTMLCRERIVSIQGEPSDTKIILTQAIDIFASLNYSSIVSEVEEYYNPPLAQSQLLSIKLVLPQDVEESSESISGIVYYYDGEYYFDTDYKPEEMMLEVRMTRFYDEDGETFFIYVEIE